MITLDRDKETTPPPNKWTPEAVRALRMRLLMTLAQFGKALEKPVDATRVHLWEYGVSKPSPLMAECLNRLEAKANALPTAEPNPAPTWWRSFLARR